MSAPSVTHYSCANPGCNEFVADNGATCLACQAKCNNVDHPAHYTSGGIEVIDAIEAWGLDRDFCLGNAVKYIARAGKKDPSKLVEDLEKARWYLARAITRVGKVKP